jgi:hypothetical protein
MHTLDACAVLRVEQAVTTVTTSDRDDVQLDNQSRKPALPLVGCLHEASSPGSVEHHIGTTAQSIHCPLLPLQSSNSSGSTFTMSKNVELALSAIKKPRFVLVSDLDHTMVSVPGHVLHCVSSTPETAATTKNN